jgi:cytochrome c oxidase subunit 3
MATTIPEPPTTGIPSRPGKEESGGGGWRSLVPADGSLLAVQDRSPEPSRTGVWVGLAAITMSFAAFTSALIVRQGSATDWRHIALPSVLYLNTLVLLASSATLEVSRRRVASFMRGVTIQPGIPLRWLYATLLLGMVFVVGQYAAWLRLKSEGLYLATNPSSSFFYVLTAMHALHVLGGLAGLARVIRKLSTSGLRLRRSTLDATAQYWHFMGILWLYLLLVLQLKL